MHVEGRLLLDFVSAVGAGWLGGLLAHRLRLPLLVGYIVAGIVIGPHALGIIRQGAEVQAIAGLGVVLLLFALGVQLTLSELGHVRKVAVWGGLVQIVLTIVLGALLGRALGWPVTASQILGFSLALGSTAVLVSVLGERGEVHTQYARVVIGMNITQDLVAVVLVGLLPALGSLERLDAGGITFLPELGGLFVKGGLFLGLMLLFARVIVPRLLRVIARTESREIFLTTVILLCLGGAAAAELLGLSLALGAFLAGVMVSESEFHYETFATVAPLRDIFGLLFFASLGMFLDPAVLLRNLGEVAVVFSALIVGKSVIVFAIVLASGYHLRTSIMSAFALAQIGEFSFVIIQLALGRGYLDADTYGIIIGAAVLSMVTTPVMLKLGPALYAAAARFGPLHRFTRAARENKELARARRQRDHVLLCGYGRVGRIVGETLRYFGVPLVIIDYDQFNVEHLRKEGLLALYGDASSEVLLEQAGMDDVRMAVLCLPDSRSTHLTLRHLNGLNPGVPMVARGATPADLESCYRDNAEEVVEPEVECGLELARHTLLRLGHEPDVVQRYLDQVRLNRYRCPVRPEVEETRPQR